VEELARGPHTLVSSELLWLVAYMSGVQVFLFTRFASAPTDSSSRTTFGWFLAIVRSVLVSSSSAEKMCEPILSEQLPDAGVSERRTRVSVHRVHMGASIEKVLWTVQL
jgi:hypothetical protein